MIVCEGLDRIPLRLVFTTGDDAFQAIVRSSTKCAASHAAIGIGDDGEWLLHAYEDGVMLEPRSEWFGVREQRLVSEFMILPDLSDGVTQAMSHLGKRYDGMHVFKIGLMRLLKLAKLGKPERDDAFTCARFVLTIDPHGDIPEWQTINAEAVVPRDLLDAALVGQSFQRLV